jgi:hypothetical protein
MRNGEYRLLCAEDFTANALLPEHSLLVEQAQVLCREHNASLFFLTLFGSSLYGTETPGKSDVDAQGIFLPSVDSLILNKAPKSLHYSTGNNERRNLSGDREGGYTWREIEACILERLKAVDALQKHAPFVGVYDAAFAEACVPACYDDFATP